MAGFFLIAGSVSSSHRCCASRLARERSLRGRCTLKPSRCSSSGTYFQWYVTSNSVAMSAVTMRAVQTADSNPAAMGPPSTMRESRRSCAPSSFGVGPRGDVG
jgi:hypothetical protein